MFSFEFANKNSFSSESFESRLYNWLQVSDIALLETWIE